VHLSDITVTDIFQSFTYKVAAKINSHRYGTKLGPCVIVTLCISIVEIEAEAEARKSEAEAESEAE